jgi:hypothetical protein
MATFDAEVSTSRFTILASQAVSAGLNSDVASTAMLMFLRFGVMPEARSIAGTLTERLLSTGEFGRNISCEFDFANDPVLVEAWLKQADAWSKATGAPVATRSEARDKLGLPDRDDEFPTLDEPLVPVGMITEGESASPGADPVASSTSKPPASSEAPASNQVASEDNPADINESRSLARMDRDAMRTRSDRDILKPEGKWFFYWEVEGPEANGLFLLFQDQLFLKADRLDP